MTTTTTETNTDGLRDQISRYEQELADAEREIGAAALDGKQAIRARLDARAARSGDELATGGDER
jgi:hypothetical protein